MPDRHAPAEVDLRDGSSVPVVVVGAGGFGREVVAACASGATVDGRPAQVLGFVDDADDLGVVSGTPVLGGVELARAGGPLEDVRVVVSVGNPRRFDVRRRIVAALGRRRADFATVVHPGAHLSPSVDLGVGTVVLAGVVGTADVTVGDHVAIMPGAVLTHDVVVGDHATLASGVLLGGGVHVRAGAYVGAGAVVREGVTVGEGALVGAGATVLHDVEPGHVVVGSPARVLRTVGTAEARR